jgi:pilus assembly protein Flp/PilA
MMKTSYLAKAKRFLVSEDGPMAVEYAVMLALILVACITVVSNLGTTISGAFNRVESTLSNLTAPRSVSRGWAW